MRNAKCPRCSTGRSITCRSRPAAPNPDTPRVVCLKAPSPTDPLEDLLSLADAPEVRAGIQVWVRELADEGFLDLAPTVET